MSHADHQDFLADPEPLTPQDRAWEQLDTRLRQLEARHHALRRDLAALYRAMHQEQQPWVLFYAGQLLAIYNTHRAPDEAPLLPEPR